MEQTRRSFIGMASMLGAAAMAGAGTAMAEPTEVAPITPAAFEGDLDRGVTKTSINELMAARRAAIDACEDVTCEDGTVIEKIWVQVRAVVDGMGCGVGLSTGHMAPESFRAWQILCNDDPALAEAYVFSPIGIRFTALDTAVALGIDEADAKARLDALTFNGMLMRITVEGLDLYQHQRYAHGICESSMNQYHNPEYIPAFMAGISVSDQLPFPAYYPIPVNADVVAEKVVYAYDDIEGLLARHNVFAVSPCQCHYLGHPKGAGDVLPEIHDREAIAECVCANGVHLEKCVTFGEEAAFYVQQGIGREITRDEAREILVRAVEEGCVLESCYTKYTEVICCCDGCGVMLGHGMRGAVEPDYNANISHYNLQYDADACLKCGICAERCPMDAITMDEDGAPTITYTCIRCGQCAYVCPVEARKLTLKPEDQIAELPVDILDWSNVDAAWRYEKGLWPSAEVRAGLGL